MPRSSFRPVTLFVMLACLGTGHSQSSAPEQASSAPALDTPQAHADTLRRYIVEQYATRDMRAAFNQPAQQPLDLKQRHQEGQKHGRVPEARYQFHAAEPGLHHSLRSRSRLCHQEHPAR